MKTSQSPARDMSYELAIESVKFCRKLQKERNDYLISNQLLKSSTSIGANIEEAIGGQSDKDFLSKVSIAYKEARETSYWLRIIKELDYIEKNEFNSLYNKTEQIIKILGATIRTMKKKLQNSPKPI